MASEYAVTPVSYNLGEFIVTKKSPICQWDNIFLYGNQNLSGHEIGVSQVRSKCIIAGTLHFKNTEQRYIILDI